MGLAPGAVGVTCFIVSSIRLFRATRISLTDIQEEAQLIRARHTIMRYAIAIEDEEDFSGSGVGERHVPVEIAQLKSA